LLDQNRAFAVKIVTVLGTRPEIIRLARVIEKLDQSVDHVLVHTGQNFDPALSDLFFEELHIRRPNHRLEVKADTPIRLIARILERCEEVFAQIRPDRLLILGDTNSALCAVAAKRMGIPVFHMEAGNRCYDDRVPEEINRRIIDHASDVLMPYTERSRDHLLREGIPGWRIFVTGNPILEVIEHYHTNIEQSNVVASLGAEPGGYFLVTLHRAENVDVEARLANFAKAFELLSERHKVPVIVSTHPRTAVRMTEFGISAPRGDVRFAKPFGFFDFIALERNARCVLSDSGTVQEECAIFGVPNVTLRDTTERPETIECGSNMLTGADPDAIQRAVAIVLGCKGTWQAPPEYLMKNVSDTVLRIVTGYHHGLGTEPKDG
jgi:UDP-N-acetylglucosamine 2-epimerase (non-hydrolysing)